MIRLLALFAAILANIALASVAPPYWWIATGFVGAVLGLETGRAFTDWRFGR